MPKMKIRKEMNLLNSEAAEEPQEDEEPDIIVSYCNGFIVPSPVHSSASYLHFRASQLDANSCI